MKFKFLVPYLLFAILTVFLYFYYEHNKIIFLHPQSIHGWRQADVTSMTLNYYQHGMNFFKPELHCIASDGNTTGYCVSEAPIIYYFTAILYKIFGPHDFLLRMVNLILFFIGLLYLFKTLLLIFKSVVFPLIICTFVFSSPVLVYYANNFLPDTVALAMIFIGWYFFTKFFIYAKQKDLFLTIIFFTLASLFKVTTCISVIIIGILYLLDFTKLGEKLNNGQKIFKNKRSSFVAFCIYAIIVGSWYGFAIWYNKQHNSNYFANRFWPLWSLNQEEMDTVRKFFWNGWLYQFFNRATHIFLIVCFVFNIVFILRTKKILNFISYSLLVFSMLYFLLWYYKFSVHDYYGLIMIPFFISVLINFLIVLQSFFQRKFEMIFFTSLLSLFIWSNVNGTKMELRNKYKGEINWENPKYEKLYNADKTLDDLGIGKDKKVIVMGDYTYGLSLYLINRKGWTEVFMNRKDTAEIRNKVNVGAEYLIMLTKSNEDSIYLKKFINKKVGQLKDYEIFDISKRK